MGLRETILVKRKIWLVVLVFFFYLRCCFFCTFCYGFLFLYHTAYYFLKEMNYKIKKSKIKNELNWNWNWGSETFEKFDTWRTEISSVNWRRLGIYSVEYRMGREYCPFSTELHFHASSSLTIWSPSRGVANSVFVVGVTNISHTKNN